MREEHSMNSGVETKTYRRPSVKVVAMIFIAFTVVMISLLIYALITANDFAVVGIPFIWAWIGGILSIAWYYENRGILQLSDTEIRFYYKLFSNSKEMNGFNKKGLVIRFEAIEAIDIVMIPGDWFILADTKQLVIRWKDGRVVYAYLYHFGKKQESEIIEYLAAHVKTNESLGY